ncbi:phosphoribosyl-ATP pyrophosphatase [Elstera litoralis]|uniref:Phosphoribosyl-ATP pyrophosphatase n=2 Tax=Elstera litoralis TaxID=552518 RepID=A0A0F3INC6_9PROT|nr:phosphoribosyl-ATP pyrophosphatase [Elstera litoralis]
MTEPSMTPPTAHILDQLFSRIESKRKADPETSYTAKMFARGTHKIAQKVGEEAVEVVIEAIRGKRKRLVSESADLLYHLTLLWAASDVEPGDVWRELARREGVSGYAHLGRETDDDED